MRSFEGKRAIVTGATGGIGRAICRELALRGTNLVLVDRDEPALLELADEFQASDTTVETVSCDLLEPTQIDGALDQILAAGPVDVLINNAGLGHYGMVVNMEQAQWDQVMGVNLLAPIRVTNRLLPHLAERPEAHIVNMASMLGFCGVRRLTAYCTTKAALIAFSECLRTECGKNRIGVSAVCPGFVNTPFFGRFSRGPGRHAVPTPPDWICTTAEKVARKVVKAIRKNRRIVLSTPLAYLLYYVRRIAPGLLIGLQRLSRKSRPSASPEVAASVDNRKAA